MRKSILYLTAVAALLSASDSFAFDYGRSAYSVRYTNEDGSVVTVSAAFRYSSEPYGNYFIQGSGPGTNSGLYGSWAFNGIAVNGVIIPRANPNNPPISAIANFDSDGNLIEWWDRSGNVLESYKYDSNGKMMVYNNSGNLIGVYNNALDMMVSRDGRYDKARQLNYCDDDGSYSERNSNNDVVGKYYQDGKVEKYKYNSAGNLISSETYDKNGNQIGSYTYDAGGNLVSAYQNGKAVYLRKRYTIPEADAATQGKGPFRLDITW